MREKEAASKAETERKRSFFNRTRSYSDAAANNWGFNIDKHNKTASGTEFTLLFCKV